MTEPSTIITSIVGCARCYGSGHEDLIFRPLTHPLEITGEDPLTHWATCPTNGEPILMRIAPVSDDFNTPEGF